MKKIYSLVLLLIFVFGFSQDLKWFYYTSKNPIEYEYGSSNGALGLAIDSEESFITCGHYQDRVGFEMTTPEVYQLSNTKKNSDLGVYLVKHDKNKKYLWHKTIAFDYQGEAKMTSVAVDKEDNVIVTGSINGKNIDLDPEDPDSPIYHANRGEHGTFLMKFSKDGKLLFEQFYSLANEFARVTIDNFDNILVTGSYINYNGRTVDFDQSSDRVVNLAGKDQSSFILKLTPEGKFIWAKYVEGHNRAHISFIKVDRNNNIVVSGNNESYFKYNGGESFGTAEYGVNNADYIFKIDESGDLKWFQALRGSTGFEIFDAGKFDIDDDNSIVIATKKEKTKVNFKNFIYDPGGKMGFVVFKLDENGNYVWHSSIDPETSHTSSFFSLSISIAEDHTISWLINADGIFDFFSTKSNSEKLKYRRFYNTLLKLDSNGKLISDKTRIKGNPISRYNKKNSSLYLGGTAPFGYEKTYLDPNPASNPSILGYSYGSSHVQKLGKCYSGVPDGDPELIVCSLDQRRIKDLYPKTSYSIWYDSPSSMSPLSPETILENKNYYATSHDSSCPVNNTRHEVKVILLPSPQKLIIPDFTFCNLTGKTIFDLNINNNQNIRFYDEKLATISMGTPLEGNKKYYAQVTNEYYVPAVLSCKGEMVEFYIYDTSVPPVAETFQKFCESRKPKITDLQVIGSDLHWYDSEGKTLDKNTFLQDGIKYYVSQTSQDCESTKAEIQVSLESPEVPKGDAVQKFCIAQNAKLKDIKLTGTNILWYDVNGTLLANTTILEDQKTYYATQTINECESTSKLEVKVEVNNTGLIANNVTKELCSTNDTGVRSVNLEDYKKDLIINSEAYSFEFYDSSNNLILNLAQSISVGTSTYLVKIFSSLGCSTTAKLELKLYANPKVSLGDNREFCKGEKVTLDAGGGYETYLWNTGASTQKIEVNQEGTYSVIVTNSNKCESSTSVKITKRKLGTITNIKIANNTISVIMSDSGDYLYSLDKVRWQESNEFSNLSNGENLMVYVKAKLGCEVDSKSFSLFSIPNIFSPNSDLKNDTWKISGLEHYPNSVILIVDRYGKPVLNKIVNGNFEWDGSFNGKKLPTGTYWYHLKVSDGRIFNGYIILQNRN